MGDSGPVDVCVREGASECMRGFVYSHMHAHRVYGMRVRAGACVHIRVKCVWQSVLVYVRVYVYICTHVRLHKQICMICMCSSWRVCADMCVY